MQVELFSLYQQLQVSAESDTQRVGYGVRSVPGAFRNTSLQAHCGTTRCIPAGAPGSSCRHGRSLAHHRVHSKHLRRRVS